uniref:FHA domain-containing protein n=1 Tax=Picocystis salinarum TaxID=88271 RepID=A0A7S3XE79_9CHLO|mmetsp:Transcript_8954/g.31778  ORF Transcript_8954/g.31778 Transcript_8954/m.31778 type:complete len:199 (-) Transcript_8954:159-755(-)
MASSSLATRTSMAASRSAGLRGRRMTRSVRLAARTTRAKGGVAVVDNYEWVLDLPGCDAKRTSGTYKGSTEGDDVHGDWEAGGGVLSSMKDDPCASFEPINLTKLFKEKNKNELIVGRDTPNVDAVVDYDTVSRKHMKIEMEEHGDKIYVTDLGSTNGTKINDDKLVRKERRLLCGGDILSLAGDVQLEVCRNVHAHA